MSACWLMKSEPGVYGLEHLRRDKVTGWSGVRNFQARNNMRAMKPGDKVFFYHSSVDPAGIAGIAEVAKAAYPDPTQFDRKGDHYEPRASSEAPVWYQVDLRFVKAFPRLVTLEELRAMPALKGMVLLQRGSRLSVQPVTEAEWAAVLARAGS